MYTCSPESNEWHVGWNQPFSLNPHLLECWVIEYISRAHVVYKDSVSIIVPNTYAYYKCIIVWVVETLCIFLCESNYEVVDTYHLWDETHQLNTLNHPKIGLACLLR